MLEMIFKAKFWQKSNYLDDIGQVSQFPEEG